MRSHVVLVSPSYGGAEKRFFDIVTALRRQGMDIALAAPAALIDNFRADHADRLDVDAMLVPIPLETWSRLGFIRAWRRVLATLPCGSHFHYPLNCLWPLHLGRGDTLTMSMVDCTRVPSPFGGTAASAWSWLSFFFVSRIDVLNPSVLEAMRRYRTFQRMTLTPGGTFLVPASSSGQAKSATIALLCRLVPGKGIDEFLAVLPSLWTALQGRTPAGTTFVIAGYGSLEDDVAARVEALARSGVPVRFAGYVVAEALFPRSAVALSLQDITNYPSRVVAEALTSGCAVVVRDTGDSRRFGDLPGLAYCRAELDAGELADTLAAQLQRILSDPLYVEAIRDTARRRFGSQQYVDYFRGLLTSTPPPGHALPTISRDGRT
jgi:glycosyltransferase involved in cell wall biosynthesis